MGDERAEVTLVVAASNVIPNKMNTVGGVARLYLYHSPHHRVVTGSQGKPTPHPQTDTTYLRALAGCETLQVFRRKCDPSLCQTKEKTQTPPPTLLELLSAD